LEEVDAIVQHKSIIGALRTTAPACVFEQIAFVVGNFGMHPLKKATFKPSSKSLMYKKKSHFTRSFIWEYTQFQTNPVKRGASLLL